ncbi:MAG: hypothetical protein C0514_02470 [Candidatus Puniceispirillum sp.]|nr:hypothetical protein [Candidatus Puniceispirillum sp.]
MRAVLVATALVSGNLFASTHEQDFAELWGGAKTAYELAPGAAKQILTDITSAEEYTDGVQDAYAALLTRVHGFPVTVDRSLGAGVAVATQDTDWYPLTILLSLAVEQHLVPN